MFLESLAFRKYQKQIQPSGASGVRTRFWNSRSSTAKKRHNTRKNFRKIRFDLGFVVFSELRNWLLTWQQPRDQKLHLYENLLHATVPERKYEKELRIFEHFGHLSQISIKL